MFTTKEVGLPVIKRGTIARSKIFGILAISWAHLSNCDRDSSRTGIRPLSGKLPDQTNEASVKFVRSRSVKIYKVDQRMLDFNGSVVSLRLDPYPTRCSCKLLNP